MICLGNLFPKVLLLWIASEKLLILKNYNEKRVAVENGNA